MEMESQDNVEQHINDFQTVKDDVSKPLEFR